MKLRVCLEAGCGALTPFSRCEQHAKENAAAIAAQREELEPWRYFYGLQAWNEAREAARRRAGYRCEYCGALELVGEQAFDVHHRIALRELWRRAGGGTPAFNRGAFELAGLHLERLVVACDPCHAKAELEREELGDDRLPYPELRVR